MSNMRGQHIKKNRMKIVLPSEAMFGFAGFLISQKDKVDITDKKVMSNLLALYHSANKFADPRNNFMKNLVTPVFTGEDVQ